MISKRYSNRLRYSKLIFNRNIIAIYSYSRYRESSSLKEYRILPDGKNYVEYIRLDRRYDIVNFNVIYS